MKSILLIQIVLRGWGEEKVEEEEDEGSFFFPSLFLTLSLSFPSEGIIIIGGSPSLGFIPAAKCHL